MVMSLEELKRENAEDEQKEDQAPQPETETEETEAVEEESQVSAEGEAESPSEETEEAEIEPWMQTEEQASEDGDKLFTGSDVAAAKKRLRAKVEKKDAEIEELRAKVERLESSRVSPEPAQRVAAPPKLEDHDYDEQKFQEANVKYVESLIGAAMSQKDMESNQEAIRQKLSSSVDNHYERAAKLVKDAGISPDLYQDADSNVRNMIDSVMQGQGDTVTDMLINTIGEGSEKVMYYVGRNTQARSELKSLLIEDPSGLKAAVYLGRKQTELTKPVTKITKAQKPSTQIKGDAETGDSLASLKRAYQKADKSGDAQARFDARRKAKASGADVSNW